jgi:rRNA maturation endonuclease Nob1
MNLLIILGLLILVGALLYFLQLIVNSRRKIHFQRCAACNKEFPPIYMIKDTCIFCNHEQSRKS